MNRGNFGFRCRPGPSWYWIHYDDDNDDYDGDDDDSDDDNDGDDGDDDNNYGEDDDSSGLEAGECLLQAQTFCSAGRRNCCACLDHREDGDDCAACISHPDNVKTV